MRVTMDPLHPEAFPVRSDTLTGLPGRDAARVRLVDWLDRGEPVHGLLIGLRRFDAVNLAYGAAAGDAALAEVAARIRHFAHGELEGAWFAARGGGGQFLLLTSQPCSRERWQLVSAQLLDRLALPIPVGGNMRAALDDFGAVFCNFRYLKLLPLHYLKLDRSMIEGAGDLRDLAVLRAIIAMAGALDLAVIAEGVESEAQRVLAATEGCAFYQGFLRAQPMGAAEFRDLAKA